MDDDAREELRKPVRLALKAAQLLDAPRSFLLGVLERKLDPAIPELRRRCDELAETIDRLDATVAAVGAEFILRVAEVYPWTRSEAKRERLRNALENTGRLTSDVDDAIIERIQRWVLELSDLAFEIVRTAWEMRVLGSGWPKRSAVRDRLTRKSSTTRQIEGLFTAAERELEGLGLIVRTNAAGDMGSDWSLPLNDLTPELLDYVAAPPESTPPPSTRGGEGAA